MQLLSVELLGFRNLRHALVEPHPRFNVLSGDNGQGKTNLLEAIYLVGTLRSFRAARLDEMVRFGDARALARARASRKGLDRLYEVELVAEAAGEPVRKLARVDGKGTRTQAEYFGGYNVVLFSPDDLRLPKGSPSGRRRFLDRAVWNTQPQFLKEAQTYERLLRSRNALLRDAGGTLRRDGDALLAVYDEQLARAGAVILRRRRAYLRAIAPLCAEAFEQITKSGLCAAVSYRDRLAREESIGPSGEASALESSAPIAVRSDEEVAAELLEAFRKSRGRDLRQGHTSAGPHGDDLELDLDGRPARLHASQGQLRALVLALKVAEIQHLCACLDEAPILLLDDVSSELDPTRNAFLFDFLSELRCQVYITTTDRNHVRLSAERRDFRVEGGILTPFPG